MCACRPSVYVQVLARKIYTLRYLSIYVNDSGGFVVNRRSRRVASVKIVYREKCSAIVVGPFELLYIFARNFANAIRPYKRAN